jgi:hypothetical protein
MRRGGHVPGGWRGTEVWLNPDDVQWFGELGRTVRAAVPLQPLPLVAATGAIAQPLPDLRPPLRAPARTSREPASRRRKLATRLAPTVTGLVAAGVGVPVILAAQPAEPALPPPAPVAAATAAAQASPFDVRPASTTFAPAASAPAPTASSTETVAQAPFPTVRWKESHATGLPHAGTLVDGVRFPQEGPDWVTWDPVRDEVPNRANRLFGTDELVRITLDVIASYRLAHPNAPRVVVGDLSHRGGGEIDEHASHENGLDLDVYYPRKDGREIPPTAVSQVDVRLAQDLLDRFVAAGATVVFVGQSLVLDGQAGVVVPYPNHDNHLHVRIGAGGAASGD